MRNLLLSIPIFLGLASPLLSQPRDTTRVYVWPPELYPGENVVTISSANGLRSITTTHTSNTTIRKSDPLDCRKVDTLRVFVNSPSEDASINIEIVDCRGRAFTKTITTDPQMKWTLDSVRFGRVEDDGTVCQTFRITRNGQGLGEGQVVILDSISVPDSHVTLDLPTTLPYTIPGSAVFRYRVCFKADRVGFYKFPVVTWIRRNYPSGGLTSYPVADTGYVRVYPKTRRDTVRRVVEPPFVEPPVTDPTTFRSVAVPNAIIPKGGSKVIGVYDFLGLIGSYSLTDNLMVLAGGALPTPDDWGGVRGQMFGAYSIGVKAGLPIADRVNLAVGYQWGQSLFDQQSTQGTDSKITVRVPYAAISYGDDDSRVSATLGYAYKHHATLSEEFDREAGLLAIGGDYRFATHWKVAGEIATMKTLGVVPIIATLRYFSNSYAIDLGVGYVGITTDENAAPAIPLLPVLSGVFVF